MNAEYFDDDGRTPPVLTIKYKGSEYTPDGVTQYASFEAFANSDGFAGKTAFEAIESHIRHFVQQLFDNNEASPEFVTGWGDDVYFALRFCGGLMHCEIKQPGTGEHRNSISLWLTMSLNQVDEMARFFRAAVTNQEPRSFYLRNW